MLVRQRTANPNPLLSSPSDNASSTPPLYIVPPTTTTTTKSFVKNLHRTFWTQLFNFLLVSQSCIYTRTHTSSKNHKYYENYLVHSQCKCVCSLISLTCDVCLCVRAFVNVWEVINIESQRVPFWFFCDVFAWSFRVQLWPTGLWTHQLFSSPLLKLRAGDECWSLDAAHRSLGALVAPLKAFWTHLSALSYCANTEHKDVRKRAREHIMFYLQASKSPSNFLCYTRSHISCFFTHLKLKLHIEKTY